MAESDKQEDVTAQGATPEANPGATPDQAGNAGQNPEEIARKLQNKTEEADRLHKKLEAIERAEEERKKKEMSELERLKAENAEKDAKLKARELEDLRKQAAKAAGLSEDLAGRLQGVTLEDLTADAKALAESLPKPAEPKPEKKQIVKATAPESAEKVDKTEAEFRSEVFGNPASVFDPKIARGMGGGVFSGKPADGESGDQS